MDCRFVLPTARRTRLTAANFAQLQNTAVAADAVSQNTSDQTVQQVAGTARRPKATRKYSTKLPR